VLVSAYHYANGAWTAFNPRPNYQLSSIARNFFCCDCDATGDKIVLTKDTWGGWCNAAMCDVVSTHRWSAIVNSVNNASYGGISADASLVVIGHYGGRLYIYDKDTLPAQASGGYYKDFTYTHAAGTRVNHKIRVKVYNKYTSDAYLHCEGRANDDFSDIYFKNAAGDTLRHCMVKDEDVCNTLNLGYYRWVWIELDAVGTSPATFRMYYGDSEHSDSSTTPADFFDQYDDFERGADGNAVGGNWTVTAGSVQIDTAFVWRGTRCAEFVGAGTPGVATIPATAGDETYIGFWLYKYYDGEMYAAHGDGSTYARWEFRDRATLKNYTGGVYQASMATPDTWGWLPFEMCGFDWEANTYDLYSDTGYILRGDDLAMQASAGFTNVLQIANLGGGGSFLRIDQVVICTNCTPYASPDAESIGAEVLVGEVEYSGPAGVKAWNEVVSANIKTWNDIPWNTIKTMN
jgi:hypothetical protein